LNDSLCAIGLQLWFSHVLRDAFAAQAAGLFRSFKDVGAYHLEVLLRQAGKDERWVLLYTRPLFVSARLLGREPRQLPAVALL
jgi:hypothetical protein